MIDINVDQILLKDTYKILNENMVYEYIEYIKYLLMQGLYDEDLSISLYKQILDERLLIYFTGIINNFTKDLNYDYKFDDIFPFLIKKDYVYHFNKILIFYDNNTTSINDKNFYFFTNDSLNFMDIYYIFNLSLQVLECDNFLIKLYLENDIMNIKKDIINNKKDINYLNEFIKDNLTLITHDPKNYCINAKKKVCQLTQSKKENDIDCSGLGLVFNIKKKKN
jgi:hypothetical protein